MHAFYGRYITVIGRAALNGEAQGVKGCLTFKSICFSNCSKRLLESVIVYLHLNQKWVVQFPRSCPLFPIVTTGDARNNT